MWYQIELTQPLAVAELIVDASTREPGAGGVAGRGRGGAIPAVAMSAYRLQVSMDGKTWGSPLAEGPGQHPSTTISFAPVRAKFIRITQTGTPQSPFGWSIQRVRIFAIAP